MASPAPIHAPVVPTSGSPAPTAGDINGSGPAPSTSGLHHNVVPSEVGWQFVPQYYTFVNKSPNRLHKFYTRNSTFIHGTEGEEISVCYGQQDIHQRIMQIGYQDCKVFIHSVDAQSSAAGGIIIQVIGEMSNAGESYRKFVQTFFLAEQPNGYFVLNDIFRFLKEDTAGEDEEDDVAAPAPAPAHSTSSAPIEWPQQTATPVPEAEPATVPEPPREPTPPPVEKPAPEPELVPEPPVVEEPKSNGIVEPTPTPAVVREPTPEPEAKEAEPTPAPPSPAPEAPPVAEAPAPVAPVPAPAAAPAPAPAPAQPPAPPKPKTWANLAASGAGAWGTNSSAARAVSVQAKPAVVKPAPPAPAPAPAPPAAPRPASGTAVADAALLSRAYAYVQTPAGDGDHPNYTAATTLTNGQCFVKGVTETVSTNVLKDVLTTRFGAIKELDIVRSKACAFLEFTSPESARRAVIACLPVGQGGEGGIRIEGAGENGGPQRITVEARKERGDRPPPRPHRGGVPPSPAADGRGSFRGRAGPPPVGGAAGRGRGAPPPGGAKA
ncbi:hypothetical protein BKA62DRAFT_675874 [Auriculariales sp. MPI-PUGE-AT-0066]|nr:hypothetical protein BKA62DRAFT_675874 [Auriculariales sp. MPI-PUGE-AT-0066]